MKGVIMFSEEVWKLVGASGCNGAADPRRLKSYYKQCEILMAEYDNGGMPAQEFHRRFAGLEQP
jgi:hypothetical protein